MAITYPRTLPCGVTSVEFEIARGMSTNRLTGGAMQVREAAEPRWRAAITYAPMSRAEFQGLQAWLDTARGGLRPFLVHDPLKPYPLMHPKAQLLSMTRQGGGAFDGTATVTAFGPSDLYLGNLPPGFTLKPGDMVGLVQAGRYALHRISEEAIASAGGTTGFLVEPRVQTSLFSTAAVAQLVRPACLMVLDAASVSAARTAASRSPISFSAVQVLS